MILKTLLFDPEEINKLKEKLSWRAGMLSLLGIVFVFVLPTDLQSLMLASWLQNFIVVLLLFCVVISLVYGFMHLLGSKTDLNAFASPSMSVLLLSLLAIAVPAFFLSHFIFTAALGIPVVSQVLFSLIPYYSYLMFGWACEITSELKGWKAIACALFSMTTLLVFHYLLRFVTI